MNLIVIQRESFHRGKSSSRPILDVVVVSSDNLWRRAVSASILDENSTASVRYLVDKPVQVHRTMSVV